MTLKVIVYALAATIAGAACTASAATSDKSDKSDAVAAVKHWAESYNKGDTKAFLAACSSQAVIIDSLPPHVWQGAGACSEWLSALQASDKQMGATDGMVTVEKPLHVDVTGDRAYVVVRAKFNDKEKGKPVEQSATWTVILQKSGSTWNIAGSAWAAH